LPHRQIRTAQGSFRPQSEIATKPVAIAELFSVNRRTLSRHLNREGTAYQLMVNGLRFEIACELLTQSGMTFGQIAAALGYSELSGFTRAFRHWSGQTPTEWRSRHAHLQNKIHEEG
jgi:AraC-like DNA-binding protein